MHKTATTSLQRLLLDYEPELQNCGYKIIVNACQLNVRNRSVYDADWVSNQFSTAERDGYQALIVSGEIMSTFSRDQLKQLMNQVRNYENCIVVTFRHWAGSLPSRWAQYCKRSDSQSLFRYVEKLTTQDELHPDARFDVVVERLKAAEPGNIKVVSYDNGMLCGDLQTQLLKAFELHPQMVDAMSANSKVLNITPSNELMDLCRLFNGALAERRGRSHNDRYESVLCGKPNEPPLELLGKVNFLYSNKAPLVDQLRKALRDHQDTLILSPSARPFCDWQDLVERAAVGHIVNAENGALFPSVQQRKITASRLEVEELSLQMRDNMVQALLDAGLAIQRIRAHPVQAVAN